MLSLRYLQIFSVSNDDQYALLNVQGQGLHLWDIKCGSLVSFWNIYASIFQVHILKNQKLEFKFKVRRFRGNKQGFYVIHSCFGGENDELIASGSEDATIFIFHRDRETPLIELQGHGKILQNKFFINNENSLKKKLSIVSTFTPQFPVFWPQFRTIVTWKFGALPKPKRLKIPKTNLNSISQPQM